MNERDEQSTEQAEFWGVLSYALLPGVPVGLLCDPDYASSLEESTQLIRAAAVDYGIRPETVSTWGAIPLDVPSTLAQSSYEGRKLQDRVS